ncbi:hypothetical protein [Flavobacterium sp. GNP002]
MDTLEKQHLELEKILTFLGIKFIDYKGKRCSNGHKTATTIGEIKSFFGRDVMTSGQFVEDIDWWDFKNNWNHLMFLVQKIADETGFELVSGFDYCYWNHYGENPFANSENKFGGYSDIENIYIAVVEFIEWFNLNQK